MPEPDIATPRSAVVRRAVRLHRRRHRDETGTLLAEGPQAVREAVRAGAVVEILTTEQGRQTFASLIDEGTLRPEALSLLSPEALARACDAATPQPIAAICRRPAARVESIVGSESRLIVALVQCRDPGNLGTVVRLADAVGASGVAVSADSVDPFGPKAVRASAGSIFHIPVMTGADIAQLCEQASACGIQTLAASADGTSDIFELDASGELRRPTMWLFGGEAHGLPEQLQATCDLRASIPIYGDAESLNLATAAAVCLYQSAQALRGAASGHAPVEPGLARRGQLA